MISLESLLTSPMAFSLKASPLQRAACRVIDGCPLGELADRDDVKGAIGDVSGLTVPPREVYIISGSRVGKTLLAAAIAVRASQTVDVSMLGPGDEPRIPILSLDRDKAYACYQHLTQNLKAKPHTRKLIVDEGRNELDAPAIWLRHPSGRAIQVCVAAGKAAGNAVVAYFLASVIFDEFPRMHGADSAVVNFDDSRKNALGRLLPGAQLVAIGSPWAPFGPAYEAVQKHHLRPTEKLVVIKARGRDMNPSWWTPARIAGLDEDVLRTEEQAEFTDQEESLFALADIEAAVRRGPATLGREPGRQYVAAMDPATRGDAWTLVIATRERAPDRWVVVLAKQWHGTKSRPLSVEDTMQEIAAICARYGVRSVFTDQWSSDAIRDIAARHNLGRIERNLQGLERWLAYRDLRDKIADRQVEIPDDRELRQDLTAVKRRVTQEGVAVVLPRIAGRHCDYVPALVLVTSAFPAMPANDPGPKDPDAEIWEEDRPRKKWWLETKRRRSA